METCTAIKTRRASAGRSAKLSRVAAATGLVGAIAASSCCVLPLALFAVGIGGAWIGRLAALSPYQPFFALISVGSLGIGYYRVYARSAECAPDEACAHSLPSRLVKTTLWGATALIAVALAFPWLAPLFLYK